MSTGVSSAPSTVADLRQPDLRQPDLSQSDSDVHPPTLAALLQWAPAAAAWVAQAAPDIPRIALALDLGARFIQVAGPQALPDRSGSAEKGARGEAEVFELVSRGRGAIRDVSRRAHSSDGVCDTRAGPLFIEVKHYATSVPGSEVEKFLRDLREKDAAAGVFLSLTSPIVGRKMALEVVMEPRVSTGTLVPVVYAAALRDGRLCPEVILAAVDVATYLAEVYPRGTTGLHSRDSMLSYAVATSQIAEGVASCRTDLEVLAQTLAGDCSALANRLQSLGRETRQLARAQRNEVEEIKSQASDGVPGEFLASLKLRYPIAVDTAILARVLAAQSFRVAAPLAWRQLKTRMTHVPSGIVFQFGKSATQVRFPLSRIAELTAIVKLHPKKINLADEEFGIELDEDTLPTILKLVDG